MMNFTEVFERPSDDDLVPVIARLKSGGATRDYIVAGLVEGSWLRSHLRSHAPGSVMLVWEPRTIIRYNKESGGLYGLASTGPIQGGYGVTVSKEAPACIGEPLDIMPCTNEAWKGLAALESIS